MLTILFISGLLLAACGDDDTEPMEEIDNGDTEEVENETSAPVESEDTEENGTEDVTETNEEESDDDSNSDESRGDTEDQEDLSIGDTGRFDTELTTYEITLDRVELLDELDGLTPNRETFILLDITVKNTGEDTQDVQDLIYGLEVTGDLEMTGYQNYAAEFESVEEMTGELASGEEMTGQIITEIYDADPYYFRLRPGMAASGTSNQVTWVIPVEETEKE